MRRLIRAGLLLALAGAGACQADSTSIAVPTDANVVGTYQLTIVNGGHLPFPYGATASARVDLVSGYIAMTADHAFTDVLVFRTTFLAGGSDPDQVSTLPGTWSLSGSTITLTYPGHAPVGAVVTGDLLSRNDQGLALTYQK